MPVEKSGSVRLRFGNGVVQIVDTAPRNYEQKSTIYSNAVTIYNNSVIRLYNSAGLWYNISVSFRNKHFANAMARDHGVFYAGSFFAVRRIKEGK